MSGFARSSPPVRGIIGHFQLAEWWLTAFSDDERRYIKLKYQPMGLSLSGDSPTSLGAEMISADDHLTSGVVGSTTETAVGLLSGLASWFNRPNDRPIAHKMLAKAVELSKDAPVLDVHFLCQQMIEVYYRDREESEYMDKAVAACRQQIALAPDAARAFEAESRESALPSHKGYTQLAIILEKQGRPLDAIVLSRQAASEGWAGDWERRIERCEKKLRKV